MCWIEGDGVGENWGTTVDLEVGSGVAESSIEGKGDGEGEELSMVLILRSVPDCIVLAKAWVFSLKTCAEKATVKA